MSGMNQNAIKSALAMNDRIVALSEQLGLKTAIIKDLQIELSTWKTRAEAAEAIVERVNAIQKRVDVKFCSEDMKLLETAMKSHQQWGEHFEKNPDTEKKYIESGEWDDAKTHRQYEQMYSRVMVLILRQEQDIGLLENTVTALNKTQTALKSERDTLKARCEKFEEQESFRLMALESKKASVKKPCGHLPELVIDTETSERICCECWAQEAEARCEKLELQNISLWSFATHKPTCELMGRDWPAHCTCGFDGLDELRKQGEK